ncbi:MAG: 2-hydroxyglutaryl-CoA dehydratase [Clostridiales bacterium]|nr:2-hydroxyglutaryl-CoA dehydratase [Clostridiales bacterium]
MKEFYLGVDVGSVSSNFVLIDSDKKVYKKLYLRTIGQPIKVMKEGMAKLKESCPEDTKILGVGATGSGRQLASIMVGADIVKNEITAHAVASLDYCPDVKTVLEIGGQDSKIIILRDGVVYDFAMNTVCAAGTGSFLDRQAGRLNIPIEEFGAYALRSTAPVRIAGRCAVFAESDMIHKQQTGQSLEDIINGLCQSLVRNYLNNLAKGKQIETPIIFQGGVAANVGIVKAFETELNAKIIVPENYDVMGAVGAAILAKEEVEKKGYTTFCGFDMINHDFRARSIECGGCPNICEVVEILDDDKVLARWGDRCGKWSNTIVDKEKTAVKEKLEKLTKEKILVG